MGAVRVDEWPGMPPSVFTVAVHTANFAGTIKLQASLHGDPQEDDWFELNSTTYSLPLQNEVRYKNLVYNFKGRLIWMRAVVENLHGRVDRIVVA